MNRSFLILACLLLLQLAFGQLDQDQPVDHDYEQSNSQDQSVDRSNDLNPSSGRPPVLTGISGCEYQSAVQTSTCPRPAVLTLTGSGFMTGLENSTYPTLWMLIMLSIPNTGATIGCNIIVVDSAPLSDTLFTCNVADAGFGKIASNTWMDITFTNSLTRNTTMLASAVSFVAELAPRVDRVSGCEVISADGRSASRCNFLNDYITLHGSGFMSIDRSYSTLSFGSASNPIVLINERKLIVRYNNDQIVFNFGAAPSYIPASELQSGALLPLKLADGWGDQFWSTDPVYISFIELPPPVVTVVSKNGWSQGCLSDNSTGLLRYRDCISGLSNLWVEGNFLFAPVTVTVGGHQCQIQQSSSSYLTFQMPVFQSIEGTFYDVVVSTVAGSATISGLIEFNHDPVISKVVPCVDTGSWYESVSAHCRPTETLILKVLNVKKTSVPRLWFRSSWYNVTMVECLHVQVVDIQTVTCVMPDIPSGSEWSAGQPVYIFLQWQDGSKTEELLVAPLWDPFDAPRVTSLSGCYSDSSDPLHLNQCLGQPTDGVLLTIHGVRFKSLSTSTWQVVIGFSSECYRPIVVNNQTIICLLPNLGETFGQLSFGVKYSLTVESFASPDFLTSNAGYITFVQQETHAVSPSSSTSTLTIALATVFSIVGAALLAVCLFVLCRSTLLHKRRAASRSSDSGMAPEFSSTGNHVELEEV